MSNLIIKVLIEKLSRNRVADTLQYISSSSAW